HAGLGARPHVDLELRQLPLEEQDDLLEALALRRLDDEVHLAAEPMSAFEEHHPMSPLRGNPGGLQARGAAAHDHDPAGPGCGRQPAPLLLAARDRIVDAADPETHVDVSGTALRAADAVA